MELARLIATHVLIGTSVAAGMALVPAIVWLVQRLVTSGARKLVR
jgi:hypothetical protein